jgi:hypothetical protein
MYGDHQKGNGPPDSQMLERVMRFTLKISASNDLKDPG